MITFGNTWDEMLSAEFEKDYYVKLRTFLKHEYLSGKKAVFPPMDDIFNALKATDYNNVKAVILGQDPYHEKGQAHGFCFSVLPGVPVPPSLRNIYAELKTDLGITPPNHGCLTSWAKNGVLLLNATLTVREGEAMSHHGKGWETFTDNIISVLSKREKPVAFILWGNNAKAKRALIDNNKHCILDAAHPSPLSASHGFFGCKHFSKVNNFLVHIGQSPIDWQLPQTPDISF